MHIKGFLDDITKQTIFDNCELILINANSPENEKEIITKYLKKYDNIIYKELDKDPGVYGVWNLGIEISSGDYITNANVDDRRSHHQLEILARELVNSKNIDLVYSQSFITEIPNETFNNNSSKNNVYNVEKFTKENMIKCLPGCMPLWKKSLHKKAGYFNDNYKHAGDWEMWLRAVRNGLNFKKIEGVHGLYYMNPEGLSTSTKLEPTKRIEENQIFFEYKDIFGNKIKVRPYWIDKNGKMWYSESAYDKAQKKIDKEDKEKPQPFTIFKGKDRMDWGPREVFMKYGGSFKKN